jgi:hypothetical protein
MLVVVPPWGKEITTEMDVSAHPVPTTAASNQR